MILGIIWTLFLGGLVGGAVGSFVLGLIGIHGHGLIGGTIV